MGFTDVVQVGAERRRREASNGPRAEGLDPLDNGYLAATTHPSIQVTQLTFLHCRKHPTSLQAHSKTSVQLGNAVQPQRSWSQ